MELGIASNTVGLIVTCCIGEPIASFLIRRHALIPSRDSHLEVGMQAATAGTSAPISCNDILQA